MAISFIYVVTMKHNPNGDLTNNDILCRICLDDTGEPVISPCNCKGTMGLLHLSCLERWLSESGSSTCELCLYKFQTECVVRYSIQKALWLWISMKDTARGRHVRGLWSDVAITVIITPITFGSIYFCVIAADFYSKDQFANMPPTKFTTFMLLFMIGIIALGYYLWMYLAFQYHARAWYNWWQSQLNVRVIISEDRDFTPPDNENNSGEEFLHTHITTNEPTGDNASGSLSPTYLDSHSHTQSEDI